MENADHEEITSPITIVEKVVRFINKVWSISFIRFLFVGGINTIFGYSIFSILILLQIHYSIASLLATILGILFNFFTTGRVVFENNNPKLLFKFFGVYGVIYLINLFFLKIFDSCQVNMLIAGAILVLPISILSFILNRSFVFLVNNK